MTEKLLSSSPSSKSAPTNGISDIIDLLMGLFGLAVFHHGGVLLSGPLSDLNGP